MQKPSYRAQDELIAGKYSTEADASSYTTIPAIARLHAGQNARPERSAKRRPSHDEDDEFRTQNCPPQIRYDTTACHASRSTRSSDRKAAVRRRKSWWRSR